MGIASQPHNFTISQNIIPPSGPLEPNHLPPYIPTPHVLTSHSPAKPIYSLALCSRGLSLLRPKHDITNHLLRYNNAHKKRSCRVGDRHSSHILETRYKNEHSFKQPASTYMPNDSGKHHTPSPSLTHQERPSNNPPPP